MIKSNAERTIEALTWAAVVIWLGFALVMHLLGYVWLVLMVLSFILLSSAIYQRSRGWQTSLMIWIAGVWMAVFSVIEIANEMVAAVNNGEGLQIDLWVYLGIALISMGLAVVLRYIEAPRGGAGAGRDPYARRSTVDEAVPDRRSARAASSYDVQVPPRRIQEDLSSGYAAPPQQAQRGAPAGQQPRSVRASRRTARQAPPPPAAQTPSDLESRVEDIIARSRERRDRSNLPY